MLTCFDYFSIVSPFVAVYLINIDFEKEFLDNNRRVTVFALVNFVEYFVVVYLKALVFLKNQFDQRKFLKSV